MVHNCDFDRHVSELKRFLYDPEHTDPAHVAMIDRREFVIESILDHRGDPSKKKTLEFLVRWTGYSAEYDLWLKWKDLMRTDQMRVYLEHRGLLHLLPASLR